MAMQTVPGYPQYSGNAIPVIYAAKRIVNFHEIALVPQIANTDYQGSISREGDSVVIRGMPTTNIREYIVGIRMAEDTLEVPHQTLLINQAQYFNFILDDVIQHQMDGNYSDDWISEANSDMKTVIDSKVLVGMQADVGADNKGINAGRRTHKYNLGSSAAAVSLTKENAVQYITRCAATLREGNVPGPWWMAIPPAVRAVISASDLKDASVTGDMQSISRTGRLGMIEQFTIYESNLTPAAGSGDDEQYTILFGSKYGLTFATQIVKTESLRSDTSFGDKWRGLQVWGFKVVKPEALGAGVVTVAASAL